MTMSKRKEPGQYWDTHYFVLNEWTPEWGSSNNQSQNNSNNNDSEISVEDIPF
jgi:hypothetical protein